MTLRLFIQSVSKFALGVAVTAAILFLSAGTVHYPQGWLLLAVLFIPMALMGVGLMVKNPALLRSRLQARESRKAQSMVNKLSALEFFAAFIAAGCSYQQDFFLLPMGASAVFALILLGAYGLYIAVVRENTFLSRTIQVQAHQTVVDTGLYSVVRHPMYAVTVLLFWTIPLVLGSVIGFLLMLPYPLLLVARIRDEEALLVRELAGYEDYCNRVPWRLIPHFW